MVRMVKRVKGIDNFDPASIKGRCRRCGHRNDNPTSEVCEQCWVDMGQMSFEDLVIEEEDAIDADLYEER